MVFVGAGISIGSGAPNFKDLRDYFLRPILGAGVSAIEMRDLSPEQIFSLIDDGRVETRAGVQRALWEACEKTEPNPDHLAVAALGHAGARLWTPNFDTLIERAAARADIPLGVRSDPDQPRHGTVLNKLHGSFPFTGDPPTEPTDHLCRLLFENAELWSRLPPASRSSRRRASASAEGGKECHEEGPPR